MLEEKKLNFIIKVTYFAVIIALIYLGLKYLLQPLLPFIIGILFAMLLYKQIKWVGKKTKISSKIVTVIFVFLTVAIFALIVWLICSALLYQARGLLSEVPDWASQNVPQITASITAYLNGIITSLPPEIAKTVNSSLSEILTSLQGTTINIAKNLGQSLATFTTKGIPSFFIAFIVTIIATCFITIDFEKIKEFIARQFPKKQWDIILSAKNYFFSTIGKMLFAYMIIMSITFVELSIIFTVGGVKYSILIALAVALLDILPIFGTGTVLIPWAIVSLLLGNFYLGIVLLVGYGVITIVRNFIEPKIVGETVGMPPIATLFTMYICLKLFGIAGMFAGVLSLIVLKELHDSNQIKLWK